jgi:hypothetical protein
MKAQHYFPSPIGRGYAALVLSLSKGLGEVGEGFCPIDSAHPLTQLRLASKLASLRNPLPMGEGR